MNNWAELEKPFQGFNEERTQTWIDNDFTPETAKEWLENGFNCQTSAFIAWLRDEKRINNYKEFNDYQWIKELVDKFDEVYQDFAYCDHCTKMIEKSLIFFSDRKNNLDFCSNNCQTKWNNNLLIAQNYLNYWYPQNGVCKLDQKFDFSGTIVNHYNKKRAEIIHLSVAQEQLTGTLDVSSFINLEELYCYKNQLTSIVLPANSLLKKLECSYNQLSSLELNNCLELERLIFWGNQLTSLALPKNNQLSNISAVNNYLTTFNYDSLNPLTLKQLEIHNNNLKSTDIQVFSLFINLNDLKIGNDDVWIKENKGNQFTGSFVSFQKLTKLKNLHIWNLSLQPNLEYLPSSLQEIRCNGQIVKELQICGHNLTLWQIYHSELMKKANQAIVHLTDQQLVVKKQIAVDYSFFKDRENKQASFNYPAQFTYSSFLVKDIHQFSNCSLVEENIPTKLYHIPTKTVIWTNNLSNIPSYAILSYAWGDLFNQTNRATWNYNYRDKDNKVTAEKLGVYPEYKTTGTTKESVNALKKTLATIKLLNDQHNANIEYLWMDQMCINQFDNREKEREVPKMRQYYSQVTVTLIAIDAEIGDYFALDSAEIGNDFALSNAKEGIADRSKVSQSIASLESDRDKFMQRLILKITNSDWFTRAWTFQEGLLSKQTIFMFDDHLVDGRALTLYLGGSSGVYNIRPCTFITPFGWSVSQANQKSTHLNLGEALFAVTRREQTVLLDKIYSIIGLLPYGNQINVEYRPWGHQYTIKELEDKLLELIEQAHLYNPKEILTYYGERNPTNWWLPVINSTGAWQIEESLNYDNKAYQYYLTQIKQVTSQGIQLRGHWTKKTDQHIIEIERGDRKNSARWAATIQFILNVKTKSITIKQVEEFYYSYGKQEPVDLFLDMVNFKVIEGEMKIKEYLQTLEDERKLINEFNTFQIQNNC